MLSVTSSSDPSVPTSFSDPSIATSSSSGSPFAVVGGGFDKARGMPFHLPRLILGGIIKPLQSLVGDAVVVIAGSSGEKPVKNHWGSSRALLTETPQRPAGGGSFSSSSSSSSVRSKGSRVVLVVGPGSRGCEELVVSSRSLELRPKSTEAYKAAAQLASATPPLAYVLSQGIGWQGIGSLLDGLYGTGTGSTMFVENVGMMGSTKVGRQRVI